MYDSNSANETMEVIGQVLIRCLTHGCICALLLVGCAGAHGRFCIQCSHQVCLNIPTAVRRYSLCWNTHDQSGDICSVPFSIHSNQTCDHETKKVIIEPLLQVRRIEAASEPCVKISDISNIFLKKVGQRYPDSYIHQVCAKKNDRIRNV